MLTSYPALPKQGTYSIVLMEVLIFVEGYRFSNLGGEQTKIKTWTSLIFQKKKNKAACVFKIL